MEKRYEKLSKYLSYILRHHPEESDLELDDKGFADLDKVMEALNNTKHSWATIEDIKKLGDMGDRRRFEIENGKIRALYGHSVKVDIEGKIRPKRPLFHGTSRRSLDSIMKDGLKPMNRQFVHLTESRREAVQIGKRHDSHPVVLKIDALKASEEGIVFYDAGDLVLAEYVPPRFIEIV